MHCGCAPASTPGQYPSNVELRSKVIRPGVAVLLGGDGLVGCGNIGVSFGEDGTFLIDDGLPGDETSILAELKKIGAAPPRFIVHTHWHYDHIGTNSFFASSGATVAAHENVRKRMASGGKVGRFAFEPASGKALPLMTFEDGLTLHANGDTIDLRYVGGGHTDGDVIGYWRKANVVATGDLFSNILDYPYVDLDAGDAQDLQLTLQKIIDLIDDDTIVIPGHGVLGKRADIVAKRAQVLRALDRVGELKNSGGGLEAVVEQDPLGAADMAPAASKTNREHTVRAIWQSLDRQSQPRIHGELAALP